MRGSTLIIKANVITKTTKGNYNNSAIKLKKLKKGEHLYM